MLNPKPFKALRPAPGLAHKIASLPYDVMNRAEAKVLASESDLSFLRVTRSEIELDDSVNPYDKIVYEKARENLEKMINSGSLIQDNSDSYYIYKQEWRGHKQVGVVATFSYLDYENNSIKKHEKTRKEKEDDRTNHILTTRAQTGPVFLTYRGLEEFDNFILKYSEENTPLYDFVASDGIKHTVWAIDLKNNDYITNTIKNFECAYIADGHHRAASAYRSALAMKEKEANPNGIKEYEYFLAVLFPAKQLKILPYNRVVFDLNGLTKESFFDEIKKKFSIEPTEIKSPVEAKTISMYIDKNWYLLKPNSNITTSSSVGDNLDVSILQNNILGPILNIDDPRTNKRIDFIGGIRGTEELERLVDEGKAAVAFSMYPVTVDDLMNIADNGEIMPPKSTWFEPKLRDGLLIHLI